MYKIKTSSPKVAHIPVKKRKKKRTYFDSIPQVEIDALLDGLDRPIKKRIVKTGMGWIGKNDESVFFDSGLSGSIQLGGVYSIKGKSDCWDVDDWPPRKVKITIEEL